MSDELRPGVRVKVTARCCLSGYSPGDKGTVRRADYEPVTGGRFYVITMDRDGPQSVTALMPWEIESDEP
jgi:hypothetical protein